MPTNVVKTPEDEQKWQKAKEVAEEAGQADNYAYIMGVYKKMNPERFKTAAFRSAPGGKLLGYKVMGYDPDTKEVVSGANSRIRLKLNRGTTHKMPGKGIFLGASPKYVLDYYANHDFNALITYSFDPSEVTSGSLDDREPEITVPRAKVEKVEFFDEDLKPIRIAAMPVYNSPPHLVADEETTAAGKWQGVDEKLMDRAAQILQYHNERDAVKHLIKEGVSKQDAYFAVKAGKLLNKSRMQRRRVADRHIAARRKGKSLEELGTWPNSIVTIYRATLASVARVAARHESKSVAQAISDALLHAFRYQEGIERGSHISRNGREILISFMDESYGKYDDEDEDQEGELTAYYLKALRPILKPWMRDVRRATVEIGDKNWVEIEVTLK
jgi:hypothetical protein